MLYYINKTFSVVVVVVIIIIAVKLVNRVQI